MNNLSYEIYLKDPAVREALERTARRLRMEAMNRFVFLPLVRFCGSLLRITTVIGPRLQA